MTTEQQISLYVGSMVVLLVVAIFVFVTVNRKMTSRLLRRRTKDLLREFRTNISGLESKLTAAMASREEIALEIDRRMHARDRSAAGEAPPSRSGDNWQQFRTEMPKIEDKIKQHGDKEKSLIREINALEKDYIDVKEIVGTLQDEKERTRLLERLDEFHERVSRALFSSERFVGECGETLNEVLTNVAPLFHLCDCCGASDDSIFVCLNCGIRYCEKCKGVQIGHCVKCAPDFKPLHMEITE